MNLTLNFVDPKVIDQRLIEAENLKSQATREEDFEKAAYFRDQIAKYKEMQKKKITDQDTPIISEKTIEHIIEQKTNIPVGDLKEKEQSQLIHLAEDLKSHVIGQDDAVDKIAKAIRRNRVGLGTLTAQSEASSSLGQLVSVRQNFPNNWLSNFWFCW